MGGEHTFPGTRLTVKHIGGISIKGATNSEILEDHPYLTVKDIDYARQYVKDSTLNMHVYDICVDIAKKLNKKFDLSHWKVLKDDAECICLLVTKKYTEAMLCFFENNGGI